MKCQELLGALNEYLDGESRSALCRALSEHLADCPACRIVVDNLRQTITVYRGGTEVVLPEGLHDQLHTVMREHWKTKFSCAGGSRQQHHETDLTRILEVNK
jgi:predicted anti-sigma-YlaC factor YlaD